VLTADGFETVGCPDGLMALEKARDRPPDLLVLDINMPGLSGTDVALHLRMVDAQADARILIISGREDYRTHRLIRDSGADAFVLKPFDVTTFRRAVSELMELPGRPWLEARDWYTLEELTTGPRRRGGFETGVPTGLCEEALALARTVSLMARSVDERGAHPPYHTIQVTGLALMLAARFQLSPEHRRALRLAGLAHDAGLALLPDSILAREGPLSPRETDRVREHPETISRLFEGVEGADEVASWVRHHHERWDGSGYPDGLAGEAIPLGARILTVADAFSAMTTRRYRPALNSREAAAELRHCAGTQFDPDLVAIFLEVTLLGDPGNH